LRLKRQARDGMSLVELIIVSGFSVLILGLVLVSYITGGRRSAKLELDQQGIHALQIVIERLQSDLDNAIPDSGASQTPDAVEPRALVDRSGSSLNFKSRDDQGTPHHISYLFDGSHGFLTRNGQNVGVGGFERMSFRHLPASSGDASPSPQSSPARFVDHLEVTASYAPAALSGSDPVRPRRVYHVELPLNPPLDRARFPWSGIHRE